MNDPIISTDPIQVIARVIEFYRLNPASALEAMPNVAPAELIAKEIIDALVASGIFLTCKGWPTFILTDEQWNEFVLELDVAPKNNTGLANLFSNKDG